MYFASRAQAGRLLADKLMPNYRYEDCVVVALSDGGVVVGAQIAMQLHCAINLLQYEEIHLPQEPHALAGITESGSYTYNSYYQPAEVTEMVSEYRGMLEQEKTSKLSSMHRLTNGRDLLDRNLLKGHHVILVSDGLNGAFAIDLAADYLKPVGYDKLIVAAPIANIEAVDHMHVIADDLYILNVVEDFMDTDHYYDQQDVPDHDKITEIVEKIILNWK